jgi:hypothetical protein
MRAVFATRCIHVRPLPKEMSLTIDLNAIAHFYIDTIGIVPVIQTWEEVRELIIHTINEAIKSKSSDVDFVIKIMGYGPPWMVIKIYAAVVLYCDRIYYIGDAAIQL